MANQKGGLSGLAVAYIGIGGVLVYAGFRGETLVQALREIGGGKPAPVSSAKLDLSPLMTTGYGAGAAAGNALQGVAVASQAQKYASDKYSQAKRQQSGYSDCSSFVDKILTDMGIPPPVKWASTANYRMSPQWKTISAAESKPGDIAVSSHHMVLVTANGGSAAIGQQNTKTNVRTGTVANLMGGQTYVYKTYVGRQGMGSKP
jgi:hypothetical protein